MSIPKRAAIGLTATVTALIVTACSSTASSGSSKGFSTDWPRNPDQSSTALKAGLPMLGSEMLQVHYHAHLDVIVDGKPVTVPQYVGIDENAQTITALHTHDTSGVMHIESAKDTPFKLGQFFTEWGQPLTAAQVGPVAIDADQALHVIVNGKEIAGDPAQYVLKAHDEIAVWIGAKSQTPQVPSSYNFPPGL
ncbi:hypothetical protein KGQ20_37560 [Catenulispora sp. NF23]|uniref:hypothetical protein n=1 Tax=Catenulispora pinistramenti TaxID=2705254 RepID=UPI001BA9D3C1|nr:hypothetical protein [Catenulispora pinistramenti]MBS2538471.1 hypothetical protein [Catenulispora pinistramenti]